MVRFAFLLAGSLAGWGARAVVGANDAPVLDNSKSPLLYSEFMGNNTAPSGAVGTPVSSLVDFSSPAGQVDNITDQDNNETDGPALLGIAVTAADTTTIAGTWYHTENGGATWTAFPAVSASASLLLAADANTRIYFAPTLTTASGTVSSAITFRAWDRTTGTSGSTTSTSSTGGTTAFSTSTDTASLTLIANVAQRGSATTAKSSGTAGSTVAINKPTGVAQGDVMIATVVCATTLATITPPIGWTLIRSTTSSSSLTMATYWRAAGASEGTSYSWTLSASASFAAGIVAFTGVDTVHPIDAESGNSTASSTTHTAPSLTPTLPRTMMITLHSFASSATWTPPSGMTELIDVMSETATGSSGVSLECNDLFESTSSTTGTKSAVASNNADVGAVESIVLRPVNNAPCLDATKTVTCASETQNSAAPAGAVGTLVSSLVDLVSVAGGWDNVADNDGDAAAGVALTAVDTNNGGWFYTANGGTNWSLLPAVSDSAALLLPADANARLYFQPATGYHGTIPNAITFRAWDQTSGTAGTTVATTSNGGSTAFSTSKGTAALTITALTNAPTLAVSTNLGPSTFSFVLSGDAGNVYQIETSTNLESWASWRTITNTAGTTTINDLSLTNACRFYRALLVP